MGFQTYPLPDPGPSVEEIARRVHLQSEAAYGPLSAIANGVAERVGTQGQMADKLKQRLVRSVGQRIRRQGDGIAPIVQTLSTAVLEPLSRQSAQIALMMPNTAVQTMPMLTPVSLQATKDPMGSGSVGPTVQSPVPAQQLIYWVEWNEPTCSYIVNSGSSFLYTPAAGPFKTIDEAQSAADNLNATNAARIKACQDAKASPPPTPLPPPITPPPPVPVSQFAVYVHCDTGHTVIIDLSNPQNLTDVFNQGYISAVNQTFPTVADAQNWIDTHPAGSYTVCPIGPPPSPSPPPPAPCPPALPPPPTMLVCPTDWIPEGGFPPPGSEEWCSILDQLIKFFGDIGDKAWQFLDDLLNPEKINQASAAWNPLGSVAFPTGYVIDSIIKALPYLYNVAGSPLKWIRDAIACARQLTTKAFARCDPNSLIALLAFRAFLKSLHDVEWGTDALAWVVDSLVLEFPPLEATVEYLINYACPILAPEADEAVEAWLRGYISDERFRCIYQMHGKDFASHMPFVLARSEKIGAKEAIQLVRRQNGTDEDEKDWLRRLGFIDGRHLEAFRELYWELPSIGDHLEWLRKNVFDDQYVQDFDLLNGFDERFWPKFGHDLTALGMRKEYAQNHYAAHWINPGLTQLFEMTQRLRPGRVDATIEFTTDNLLRVMQEQDVGVYFRHRLEAISHPPPSLTLVLKMYSQHTIDNTEFVERLRDLGYSPIDATAIRDAMEIERVRTRANSGRGLTPNSLSKLLQLGLIEPALADGVLHKQGYNQDEINDFMFRANMEYKARFVLQTKRKAITASINTIAKSYRTGSSDRDHFANALARFGIDGNTADAWADQIDTEITVSIVEQQVKALRIAVMRGKVNVVDAEVSLLQMGMPQLRAQQTAALWAAQLASRNPVATAAQILKWVAQGLLDVNTARGRLINLGWENPDLLLLIADAQNKLAQSQAKAASAAQKTQQQAAREAQRMARDLQQQQKELITQARGLASVRTIQAWYVEGLIDDKEFVQLLKDRAYPAKYIQEYLDEANLKKAKKEAKKSGGKPASTNGTGGTAK